MCARILPHVESPESCQPHFKNLGILYLTSIYIFEKCTQIYIYLKDQSRCFETKIKNNLALLPESILKIHGWSPNTRTINNNKLSDQLKSKQI